MALSLEILVSEISIFLKQITIHCCLFRKIIFDYHDSLFAVYDVSGAGSDRSVVVLNDIHIDIMDYIVPATCTDTEFRQMWAEFEWENKVSVNTTLADLREYLAHLLKSTNMRCLTPEKVCLILLLN